MTSQPGKAQPSQNAGEIAPELHYRTDLKQYFSALAYARNMEPVPQGGMRLSPRSRHLGRIRRILAETVVSPSLSLGPHATDAVLATVTFAAVAINAAVVKDLAADADLTNALTIEYYDGASWVTFGDVFRTATTALTRTVALAPGTSVTASGLRLRFTRIPAAPVTFTMGDLSYLVESVDLSDVRLVPFTFSSAQTYVTTLVANFADFWRDGAFAGGAHCGLSESQIAIADPVQRFDTMLLFHADAAPRRILRDGSDAQWTRDLVPFTDIPQADLGGVYTNAVTDIWNIYFRYPTSGSFANGANLYLSVSVDGEETAGIATGAVPNWTTFASNVQTAIEGLPSIASGVTVSESHATAGVTILTVQFTGTGNNGNRYVVTASVVNTADAAATTTHTQLGLAGGEEVMSAAAGWPAAGVFYQDRLFQGGFKSKKSALLASNTGEYFDLNIEVAADTGAILNNIDTDGAEEIVQFARARHLVIFTSDAEYFVSDRAISRNQPLNIVESSRNGVTKGVPVVKSEDALLYVSPDKETEGTEGIILYRMTYDDVAQAYVSQPQSLLASHLVAGIVDQAAQKVSQDGIGNRLWQVRADGTMTQGVLIDAQAVLAFTRWITDGEVKAVCVDGRNRPHIAVARRVGGVTELHLERLELGLIFDGTVEQTFNPPVTVVTGLDMHDGADVWAQADGRVVGPFTVSGGSITLQTAASQVSVGRWTTPLTRTLPLPSDVAQGVVLRRPKRVHTVKLDLIGTTSLAVGANGEPAEDVPLARAGDAIDAPQAAVTRLLSIEGLVGYSDDGHVEITQTKPGLLQWRGLTIEAKT